ncbi:MAG: SUMF1/EgtB/PvdO family nonheme iron enzyme [Saprospiraceae bacterium]
MSQLPKIFIAYAHEDRPLLKKLRTHLNVMKRQQHCDIFYDGEMMPGETWDDRLKKELRSAHIFVLLVTAEFLDSDYVNETELPKILERRSKGEAEVVAVILKDCLWELTELQHLQVVLFQDEPIEERSAYAHAAREVFRSLREEIKKLKKEADIAAANLLEAKQPEVEEKLKTQGSEPTPSDSKVQKSNSLLESFKEQQDYIFRHLHSSHLPEPERQYREEKERKKKIKEEEHSRSLDPFHDLMIPIKGGTFQMGDEHGDLGKDCRPVHEVTLKDFQLCKHPVTQAQWRAIMGEDPPNLNFKGCDDCPVESVSWDDVQEFIKNLNEKTNGNYRLPSEAEWEFAARGGNQSKKFKYAGSNQLNEVAWYFKNSKSKTQPVMQLKPNELSLYDMSGNVWEWCEDTWHDNYNGAPIDGSAWSAGGDQLRRVVRGGSWDYFDDICRVSIRDWNSTDIRYNFVGFRLASVTYPLSLLPFYPFLFKL